MRQHCGAMICGLLWFWCVPPTSTPAWAQLYEVRDPRQPAVATGRNIALKTSVSVELITGRDGAALAAREWQELFAELGVPLRVRQARLDEASDVREQVLGTLRTVTVIGRLERDGRIVVKDKTFRPSDAARFREWIRQLQVYGAKGSPEGQVLWGLDQAQFARIYAALSPPLRVDPSGLELEAVLARFELPAEYPLRFSTTAKTWLEREFPRERPVRQPVAGLSHGSALAIVLNDFGLGFRPLRTPEGTVELVVDPLETAGDVWPVGWELKPLEERKKAPKMFELVPVELDDVKLLDVFAAIAVKTETPILLDRYRISAAGIDLDKARASYPSGQVAWSLLVKRLANAVKLTREMKMDEAGKAFLWIAPLEPRRRSE